METLATRTDHLLSHGLDYYKPTMSQLAYELEPDAQITYSFHNRGQQRLLDYIDPAELQERFDDIQDHGWTAAELNYLGGITINGGQPAYTPDYLNYLAGSTLPAVDVYYDADIDDLAITTTGPDALSSLWETEVMSQVSETYFRNYVAANNLNPAAAYDEGDRRLTGLIDTMRADPTIHFSDFGTRRRFSLDWQRHVLDRLTDECPDNLLGTSNVGLAAEFNIPVIGTFAHAKPMEYAALADARSSGDPRTIRASHNQFLQDWYQRYGNDYSIALTDTFGTDFFFKDFTAEQASAWRGVRQDSGDPFKFGEKLLRFYEAAGVDARTKAVVFSDALDAEKVVNLHRRFAGSIHDSYGIGTKLTNNLGIKALNMVMKATHVYDPHVGRGADTVKLSDDTGKHTGPAELVARYQRIFS